MINHVNCPHRSHAPAVRYEERIVPIVTCRLINDRLGWLHGLGLSICVACCKDMEDYPTEPTKLHEEHIQNSLRMRMRDPRPDEDKTNPWRPDGNWPCSREQAVDRAIACGMHPQHILHALAVAVERLPGKEGEIIDLAVKRGLITAEEPKE